MKKITKQDLINCTILCISFLLFFLIITHFKYYYGSTTDWECQHVAIASYFRDLFYETHDLLPDYAFNLGNGQNIYNFAYYGFLSPIILFSYLLPFISMTNYIIISSCLCIVSASILLYFYLRKRNDYIVSFISAFIFLFSTCLTFHSHRHIMFINYMPFLILGLYGVDQKLIAKKGYLLTISVFLMIMTSYYYSISGIISLILFGIYRYLTINQKITFKKFLLDGCSFVAPFIVAVLASAIITLPTFQVILNSRGETFNTITFKDLVIPSLNIKYMLYEPYGMGLTAILIFAIINLFTKKRAEIFLGITLSLMLIFPFINYLLNATMYIDSKILIPMLPLAVYAISLLLKDLFQGRYNLKYLLVPLPIIIIAAILKQERLIYFLIDISIITTAIILFHKYQKKLILIIPLIIITFSCSLSVSFVDHFVSKTNKDNSDKQLTKIIKEITQNDQDFYRISNNLTIMRDANNIYNNINYYTSTLYSSTYNLKYNQFYYDIINNPIQNRNRVITSATPNLLYLLFSNNKYLITEQTPYQGYKLISEYGDIKVYQNDNVLPLAYVSNQIMSEDEFDNLAYPYRSEAVLKNVVVGQKTNNEFISNIKTINLSDDQLVNSNLPLAKKEDIYYVDVPKDISITYKLPEKYYNKILFIRFKVLQSASCREGDTSIIINNVKNKLTCKEWKYHNQNYQFDYIISDQNLQELNITFTKGTYQITDIETYALDYRYIQNINHNVDEFVVDQEQTIGDKIVGTVNAQKDGYFVTSIPYDNGFIIKVDNQEIKYELVNKAFVGFPITSGNHYITIEYQAPLKKLAIIISCLGIAEFVLITYIESKRKM